MRPEEMDIIQTDVAIIGGGGAGTGAAAAAGVPGAAPPRTARAVRVLSGRSVRRGARRSSRRMSSRWQPGRPVGCTSDRTHPYAPIVSPAVRRLTLSGRRGHSV